MHRAPLPDRQVTATPSAGEGGVPNPATLFEKLWTRHVVADLGDGFALLYVDRHLLNDLAARAFPILAGAGLNVRRPDLTFGTPDHTVATLAHAGRSREDENPYVVNFRRAARTHGIRLFDLGEPEHGIVHVIAAELGLALPGATIACGDSHTCTLGALGALAWGIGQTELAHVLATQTSVQRKPKTMRVRLEGALAPHVEPKDVILHVIGQLGVAGAAGHALEFGGPAIERMPMDGRFTVCNMAVELGARFGLIAPDATTLAYLRERAFAPSGEARDAALADWGGLASDAGAEFDAEASFNVSAIAPQVTWGTSPDQVIGIDGAIPARADRRALDYIGLDAGSPLAGTPVDMVFIGSCANGRLSDLRRAADVARGRHVAAGVTAWVVPGSQAVKEQAEREGLDRIFSAAGFNWGAPGCSMCAGAGDQMREIAAPQTRIVSTTNRNFIGRQGPGARTHLASPAMAAAAAVSGRICDVREFAVSHA
jgi:3-isopropylmalate/(R)-2-methylmalate dehydratase large subunit